jgi:hypothetical protein
MVRRREDLLDRTGLPGVATERRVHKRYSVRSRGKVYEHDYYRFIILGAVQQAEGRERMSIAEIGEWAIANLMYAIGALVGFALGIFYGYDGWRGSTEAVDLKDSPRVKNLLWVLGGAFSATIGDVKAIDPFGEEAYGAPRIFWTPDRMASFGPDRAKLNTSNGRFKDW